MKKVHSSFANENNYNRPCQTIRKWFTQKWRQAIVFFIRFFLDMQFLPIPAILPQKRCIELWQLQKDSAKSNIFDCNNKKKLQNPGGTDWQEVQEQGLVLMQVDEAVCETVAPGEK